jgi:hypothetical protein
MRGGRSLRALPGICLALTASPACVPGERTEEFCDLMNDAEGAQPALGIDLAWDVNVGDDFVGGDCEAAGVAEMRWELVDQHGEPHGHGESACLDGLDLCDLPPSSYVLTIEGLDASGEIRWASSCDELSLIRFDTLFRCSVPSR